MTESTVPGGWRLLLPVYLALAVGVGALTPVLRLGAWLPLSLLVVAVMLGTGAVVRWLGGHVLLASGAVAGSGLLLITLIFGQSTAFLGVVPTLDTARLFARVFEQGTVQVVVQGAPATPVPELVFLVVCGMAAVAIVQDLLVFALRVPALTGVALIVLLAIPGSVLFTEFDLAVFAVLVALYFWLLRADIRVREREEWPARPASAASSGGPAVGRLGVRAAALAAGAVVLALVVPNVVPAFTTSGFTAAAGTGGTGGISSGRVNPILNLGDDLRRPGNTEALQYTTDSDEDLYFKLATLSRFTGRTWAPERILADERNTINGIAPAPGLAEGTPITEVVVDVRVQASNTRWLPVPYAPSEVSGLDGDWYWEADGMTIATSNASTRGQDYRVTSAVPQPTREQLAGVIAPADPSPYLQRNLELPEDLPGVIRSTAQEVTAEATSDYERALALQDYFRSAEFRYSEEAPVEEGYDGNGMDVIARFLDEKIGYCVHYASAMSVMARALGIPARVAVGYLPGDRRGTEDGRTRYQVGTQDLHTWPELYFEGAGWLKFEPTPGRGDLAEYASPAPVDAPSVEPSTAPSAAAPVAPTTPPDQTRNDAGAASAATVDEGGVPAGAVVAGLLLLVLLTPAALRALRRSRRRAALLRGRAPASLAWAEVQDTARDLGLPVRSTDTPRAFAAELAERLGDDAGAGAALAGLLGALERERFAAPGSTAVVTPERGRRLVSWTTDVSAALSSHAPRRRRLAAALLPSSLVTTLRPGRPLRVGRPA
ncbi:transglutaminaseTgpA domain-containing protein [Microbacteriaceae bacterium 4G12]